jgi:hypothetical protein
MSGTRPLCRATVLAHGGPSSDIAMPRRGPSRQPLVSSAEELILGLCQQLVIDPPISTTGGPTMLKLSIHGRFRFAQEYVNHMANLRFVGGFLISLFTAQTGPRCIAQLTAAVSPLYRFSAMQLMSAITVGAKTFNNRVGFERGLWQRYMRTFASVPQTSVFGTGLRMEASFTTPLLANGPPNGRPAAGRKSLVRLS